MFRNHEQFISYPSKKWRSVKNFDLVTLQGPSGNFPQIGIWPNIKGVLTSSKNGTIYIINCIFCSHAAKTTMLKGHELLKHKLFRLGVLPLYTKMRTVNKFDHEYCMQRCLLTQKIITFQKTPPSEKGDGNSFSNPILKLPT